MNKDVDNQLFYKRFNFDKNKIIILKKFLNKENLFIIDLYLPS